MIKANKGFTLIEVMLAIAIFAIAGVALMGATHNNLSNLSHIEQKAIAQWVASNQLVASSLETTWPPKNNKRGDVELAGTKWFWLQRVEKTADANMQQVTIEVRALEKDKNPIAMLVTYLAKPEQQ